MVPETWSATDRIFYHSRPFFALLLAYGPGKSKFWKNEQHSRKHYHFTDAYHKWQSYDVWFLRYEMQQTELLVILDHFLPFYPLNNPKNQNFGKLKKKSLEISSIYTYVPKVMIICYTVPKIQCMTDAILIFYFGLFFALLPPYGPKKLKFWKNEKNSWRHYHFSHV